MKFYIPIVICLLMLSGGGTAAAQDASVGPAVSTVNTGTKLMEIDAGMPISSTSSTPSSTPGVTGTAEATQTEDVRVAYDEVIAGKNFARALASLALIGVVLLVRVKGLAAIKSIPVLKLIPAAVVGFFATDRGGVALTLGLSFLGALGHALLTSAAVNIAMFEAAAMVAVGAIGGYAGLRRLIWPKA